ncbi:Pectate lyase superfamily protein [Brevundimonas sp. SH203]|uniref:hypothetical protein n=1 Tax=Brevundimonas sp. SH203 TaxID=345167 RepID=UPI0009D3DDF6|nr:hypothetical protein [Brevundimonas sp. SH203]GAW42418.1 Pectate lyase superfamily protein [Brevundimonas sp. SH203]
MAALPENDRIAGPFIAAAGQTDFPADFPLIDAAGLRIRCERGEASTILSAPDVAPVDVNGEAFTARLTAAAQAGDRVWVYSRLPASRLRAHTPNGAVRTPTLEGDAEEFQGQLQEIRRDLDRSVAAPVGEAGFELPRVQRRAGSVLAFDAAGHPDLSRSLESFDADIAGAAAAASLAEMVHVAVQSALTQILDLASASPTAPSILNKLDKSHNLADLADVLKARENLQIADFQTRTAAQAGRVPAPQTYLRTAGFSTAGDRGGALYTRAASGQLQTADGQWWEIAEAAVTPEMFGAKGDGVTDDTAAINAAIAHPRVRKVVLQDKDYKVATVNISRTIVVRGISKWGSRLVGSTTNSATVLITVAPVELSNFTVDRSAVPADGGVGIQTLNGGFGVIKDVITQNHYDGILLLSTANSELSNVISQFNYRHGIRGEVTSTGAEPALQWKMTNVISQMNNGYGYQLYAFGSTNLQTGPVAINCGAFRNGLGGWRLAGEAGTAWNDINMYHCYSSFDNGHGFDWANCGANNQMFDTFCEWNGMVPGGRNFDNIPATQNACGVIIQGTSPAGSNLLMSGLIIQNSALDGVFVAPTATLRVLQVMGANLKDNGQAGVAYRKAGFASASTTTNIYISNIVSRREGYTTQEYGISTESPTVAAKVFVWGGDFRNNLTPSQNPASSYGAWMAVPASW